MPEDFEIIPAIDIMDGKCVRLTQGQYDKVEEFSTNPQEMAQKWIDSGAKRLHLVDLDGAKQGYPVNFNLISKITKIPNIKVQIGGGIRTEETIRKYLDEGASYIILGTRAFQDKDFFKHVLGLYGERIILGLDLKNNRVALSGWHQTIEINLNNLENHLGNIKQIIYTDISKDGTLSGPNLHSVKQIASIFDSNIIVSGGISGINDIVSLLNLIFL